VEVNPGGWPAGTKLRERSLARQDEAKKAKSGAGGGIRRLRPELLADITGSHGGGLPGQSSKSEVWCRGWDSDRLSLQYLLIRSARGRNGGEPDRVNPRTYFGGIAGADGMGWQAKPEVRAEEIFRSEPSRPTRGRRGGSQSGRVCRGWDSPIEARIIGRYHRIPREGVPGVGFAEGGKNDWQT